MSVPVSQPADNIATNYILYPMYATKQNNIVKTSRGLHVVCDIG